ncbi:MAG: ABC transporter substrate-binding protein [Bacteroidia bacterium]
MSFNTRQQVETGNLLAKQELRAAIALLIPVSEIIEDHYQGRGVRVLSPIAPERASYNRNLEPEPFDPSAASELLDKAGMIDTDKDLIRDF